MLDAESTDEFNLRSGMAGEEPSRGVRDGCTFLGDVLPGEESSFDARRGAARTVLRLPNSAETGLLARSGASGEAEPVGGIVSSTSFSLDMLVSTLVS